jgi:hypothetical protein
MMWRSAWPGVLGALSLLAVASGQTDPISKCPTMDLTYSSADGPVQLVIEPEVPGVIDCGETQRTITFKGGGVITLTVDLSSVDVMLTKLRFEVIEGTTLSIVGSGARELQFIGNVAGVDGRVRFRAFDL